MKKLLLLFSLFFFLTLSAQSYRTQIFNPAIKTLQIWLVGATFSLPVMELNGTDMMQVSFDEMSHEAHSYGFKVLHCNADWTLSGLNSN